MVSEATGTLHHLLPWASPIATPLRTRTPRTVDLAQPTRLPTAMQDEPSLYMGTLCLTVAGVRHSTAASRTDRARMALTV